MKTWAILLALVTGGLLSIQVAMNGLVRGATQSTIVAVLINFLIGLAAVAMIFLLGRSPVPSAQTLTAIPWWAYLAGLCGAFYIATSAFAGPAIGVTALLAFTLLGQASSSVIIDHYGLMGIPMAPFTLVKLLGVGLVLVGALLIVR